VVYHRGSHGTLGVGSPLGQKIIKGVLVGNWVAYDVVRGNSRGILYLWL
jgi:hypothetical protein